jgi:hypothetical protein
MFPLQEGKRPHGVSGINVSLALARRLANAAGSLAGWMLNHAENDRRQNCVGAST